MEGRENLLCFYRTETIYAKEVQDFTCDMLLFQPDWMRFNRFQAPVLVLVSDWTRNFKWLKVGYKPGSFLKRKSILWRGFPAGDSIHCPRDHAFWYAEDVCCLFWLSKLTCSVCSRCWWSSGKLRSHRRRRLPGHRGKRRCDRLQGEHTFQSHIHRVISVLDAYQEFLCDLIFLTFCTALYQPQEITNLLMGEPGTNLLVTVKKGECAHHFSNQMSLFE